MRLSLATTGAAFALILVLWTISLLVVLPLLQSDINPSESQYLETCRREYGHCRSERPFERQYSFNPQQPEIDIVYTWVNGSDPAHQRLLEDYRRLENKTSTCEEDDVPLTECIEASKRRFEDHDELLYSLRSVDTHMPWVRLIHLVTNGQVPYWLNTSHPKIRLVTHEDIFKWPEHLPTFNSLAIESHLHRIPGLSEHFIYFNDDMLLANEVYPTTWYNQNDGQKLWFFWPLDQHPDVPHPPRKSYDRTQRCPPCECDDIDDSNPKSGHHSPRAQTAPNADNTHKEVTNSEPYYTREVGDPVPVSKPYKLREIEAAAAAGVDFMSHETYPWSEKVSLEHVADVEVERKSTGREELSASGRRRLLAADSVRKSLLKTHKLMHDTFGFADRLEPSHLPLYVQKDVMKRLRKRFPEEYASVSSHRFRDPMDMHFHFSYSYFLMHERKVFNFAAIFAEMDSDHSSILEHLELQRLATTVLLGLHKRENVYRSPPLATNWGVELVKHCEFAKQRLLAPYASRSELESCKTAMDKIEQWYRLKLRNRYMLGNDDADSSFLQVGTNFQLKREIEFIYMKQPKFVCINDDIDYTKVDQARAYVGLMRNFYETMYPLPSSFERYL